jgi:hypothetical protein
MHNHLIPDFSTVMRHSSVTGVKIIALSFLVTSHHESWSKISGSAHNIYLIYAHNYAFSSCLQYGHYLINVYKL